MRDDRALSSALGYMLTIVIAVALTTGLVLGAEAMIQQERETAVRSQLEIIGEKTAATVMTVDRFNDTSTEPMNATVTREFPTRAAGSQYRVELVENSDTGRFEVTVESADFDITVRVPLRNESALRLDQPVNGGTISITYDPTQDHIRVDNE